MEIAEYNAALATMLGFRNSFLFFVIDDGCIDSYVCVELVVPTFLFTSVLQLGRLNGARAVPVVHIRLMYFLHFLSSTDTDESTISRDTKVLLFLLVFSYTHSYDNS